MTKIYVGIDISKDSLDMAVHDSVKQWHFTNNEAGIKKICKLIADLKPTLVVCEATGGYEMPLCIQMEETGIPVALINPRQIRDFAKATGKLAKTDQLDARAIAHFAAAINPPPQVIVENPDLKEKDKILQSIPGVGPVVSASMIAGLPELGKLDRKKIAALTGVAPLNRDSGTMRGKRTIWGGRSKVRTMLYIGTLVAIRYNPVIKVFYQRLYEAGKSKKTAIIACMHKLLSIANTMIRSKSLWKYPTPCLNNN